MKYKLFWYLAPNGMIGKYHNSPGDDWRGPYDSIRDLKNINQETKRGDTMNAEEVKKEKEEVEAKITEMLKNFREKTGFIISDIRIDVFYGTTFGTKGRVIFSQNVLCKVEL